MSEEEEPEIKIDVKRDSKGRWQKGHSANPGGALAERKRRRTNITALRKAMTRTDGSSELVDAIRQGVLDGEASLIKLAAEYLWGRPEHKVTVRKIDELPDAELAELAGKATKYLQDVVREPEWIEVERDSRADSDEE